MNQFYLFLSLKISLSIDNRLALSIDNQEAVYPNIIFSLYFI